MYITKWLVNVWLKRCWSGNWSTRFFSSVSVALRARRWHGREKGMTRKKGGIFKLSHPPAAVKEFYFIYILLHVCAQHPEEARDTLSSSSSLSPHFPAHPSLSLCVSTFNRALLNIFCRANNKPAPSLSHLTHCNLTHTHTHAQVHTHFACIPLVIFFSSFDPSILICFLFLSWWFRR